MLINARLAADAAGATKMDRPEWAAVHPRNGEVYFTLTNNAAAQRPIAAVDAANPRFYNDKRTTGAGPEGQSERPHHPLRGGRRLRRCDVVRPGTSSCSARAPGADAANVNLSGLTDANDFSSPDGLWFSYANPGLLWIQTDDGAYTDVTNCMMLAAFPASVGDGARAHDHQRRRRREPDRDDVRRQGSRGERSCGASWSARRSARSPASRKRRTARRCSSTSSIPGEATPPNFATGAFGSHWPDGGVAPPALGDHRDHARRRRRVGID